MRFHQPVLSHSNGIVNIINVNHSSENEIPRKNFPNGTEGLKLNNLSSGIGLNKTTTLEDILKLKPGSRYFRNYFDSKVADTNNADLENGNDGIVFIETINFTSDNLSEVRDKVRN